MKIPVLLILGFSLIIGHARACHNYQAVWLAATFDNQPISANQGANIAPMTVTQHGGDIVAVFPNHVLRGTIGGKFVTTRTGSDKCVVHLHGDLFDDPDVLHWYVDGQKTNVASITATPKIERSSDSDLDQPALNPFTLRISRRFARLCTGRRSRRRFFPGRRAGGWRVPSSGISGSACCRYCGRLRPWGR
jgi:hypothetical protein